MKHTRDAYHAPHSMLLSWLLAVLLSVFTLQVQANDWMKYPDKFYMSNHSDHVTFNVFLADLDSDDSDTEWYTLQGYKIGRKPKVRGVYIHRGEKVTIK